MKKKGYKFLLCLPFEKMYFTIKPNFWNVEMSVSSNSMRAANFKLHNLNQLLQWDSQKCWTKCKNCVTKNTAELRLKNYVARTWGKKEDRDNNPMKIKLAFGAASLGVCALQQRVSRGYLCLLRLPGPQEMETRVPHGSGVGRKRKLPNKPNLHVEPQRTVT